MGLCVVTLLGARWLAAFSQSHANYPNAISFLRLGIHGPGRFRAPINNLTWAIVVAFRHGVYGVGNSMPISRHLQHNILVPCVSVNARVPANS